MKQALNRLALYCAAMGVNVRVNARGFFTVANPSDAMSTPISVDELADRVEAMNSAPVSSNTDEAESALRTLRAMGYAWRGGERWAPPIGDPPAFVASELVGARVLHAEGYEQLADVLHAAFHQAARGKGKERHANAAPFQEQSTQQIMQLLDSTDGALHQAIKKLVESKRLPHERAEAEQLGAIIYVASAILAERRRHADRTQAANDPTISAHRHA